MLFHRIRDYLGLGRGATGPAAPAATVGSWLDETFALCAVAAPAIWAQPSAENIARQAKFEVFALAFAVRLARETPAPIRRRALLEGAIDRLEVGLREAGVGDMSVGKDVRVLAAALHGRMQRYEPLVRAKDEAGVRTAAAGHGVAPAVAHAILQKTLASESQIR